MKELRETKLYPPVKAWLEEQGYIVFPELWDRDIVAHKGDHIIVIELKMTLSRAVYCQLSRAASYANELYAAVPTKPRSVEMFRQRGYGILRVSEGVECILPAATKDGYPAAHRHACAIETLRSRKPLTVQAGMPTLAGTGPAQRCAAAVREYLKANPTAGWKEIFRDVPNHYLHYRSMRGAMPTIEALLGDTP